MSDIASHFSPLNLSLDGFEGPLDLLLHLIRKHELDIFDIPISFITEEYLKYLEMMKALDLGVAGEYLVMAATLLHIKSRMLLPRPEPEEDENDEDEGDPRANLVRQLLEYQRYRDAAEKLGERDTMGATVFTRPSRRDEIKDAVGPPDLVPLDLFHLLGALKKLLADKPAEVLHEVSPDKLTIKDAIGKVATHLQDHPRCTLLDLVYLQGEAPTRMDIVVTFMALLELAKLRVIKLFQTRLTTSELIVERAVIDYDEVAQKIEGLEPD